MEGILVSKLQTPNSRYKELLAKFEEKFGKKASVVVRVPGRVNLIGEHIDYCGYAVHPMAIEQDILLALAKHESKSVKLSNIEFSKYQDHEQEGLADLEIPRDNPAWW